LTNPRSIQPDKLPFLSGLGSDMGLIDGFQIGEINETGGKKKRKEKEREINIP
jgi:hypothetical protein